LTYNDFTDRRFTRLKWLNHLLESGELDGGLRWRTQPGEKVYAAAGERL
jgi:hypothetical protein